VKDYMAKRYGRVMLNAMNYLVNRETFVNANREAFDNGFDPKCADSLFINYSLIKAGCLVKVVPGMQYEHRVHSGSYYREGSKVYPDLVPSIEKKIAAL
jgi:hypothetical protein